MKKIVIIGAGIAGLSTYHALRKYVTPQNPSLQIVIYESHPSPSVTTSLIGGGLGLAPNGFRALNAIAPGAVKFIEERGFECKEFVMRNQKGKKLGSMRHWEGGTKVGENGERGFGMVMVARGDVHWSLLKEEDGEKVEDVVRWGKRVKEIREEEDRVEVVFEDGEIEICDLVIGADGAWSKCREAIFGEEYQPKYDGLTGVGGFLPLNSISPRLQEGLKEEAVTMTFSRSGFFGYSMCTNPSAPSEDQYLQWWSTYEAKTPLSKDAPLQEVRAQLLNRHGMWKSPYDTPGSSQLDVFPQIINLACSQAQKAQKDDMPGVERSKWLILPRFMTPRLPHWTSLYGKSNKGSEEPGYGRIILVGDARNTMPPDSGQGVSCAVEDVLAVALLLKHLSKPQLGGTETTEDEKKMDTDTLKKVAKAYEDIRLPRVGKILDDAQRRGEGKKDLGFFGEKIRDTALFIVSSLPTSIFAGTYTYDVEKEVDGYLAKQEWRW
ncbi:hypothetical protein D9758_003649 [Tetrapyrgos nigripes]|uniref:FAD-binding domain-containing protein n=1 Tax=Tetrapyrgos nigripes TaxID=182062 RepID=A0A8H5GMB1_9AGAR|nr:hypothetical protein D9758_003649 [Tetrapyrgos nigripes]